MWIQPRLLMQFCLWCATFCFMFSASLNVSAVNVQWDGEDDDNWNWGVNWDLTICNGIFCAFVPPGENDIAFLSDTTNGNRVELSADVLVDGVRIRNGFTVDTNGHQLQTTPDSASSASYIEINGSESRLLVEGDGGPDLDLITSRFELFAAGATLQLDDASAIVTSASGMSSAGPATTIRGNGTITFTNTPGTSQVVFDHAGLIDVWRGDLTIRAENGGILDLDGSLGDDGILEVDDGEFFGISGSRTLRIEGPQLTAFDGAIRIGRGDTIDFELPWQLGQTDQPGIPGSAALRMRGRTGTATVAGAAVTVKGGDTFIDVESGTARFEAPMDIQHATLTMANETGIQFVGDTTFTGGSWAIADDSTIEIIGDVELGENLVITSGNDVGYDLIVSGSLTVRTDPFDWDARPQAHTTTVQGGTLRILSPQIDTLGGTIDEIPDRNDFGGVLNLNSEPGRPVVLEVATDEPWILSREMFIDATADDVLVEGAQLRVGYTPAEYPLGTPETHLVVTGANAEIAADLFLSTRAILETDPSTVLNVTGELVVFSAAKMTGGGTIRSNLLADINASLQLSDVQFVNAGEFYLDGNFPVPESGSLDIDGFEQTADGVFYVDLGGTAIRDFDQLVVSGSTNLDGLLQVSLVRDFMPALGDSFVIIDTAGSASGTFVGLAEGALVGNFAGVDFFITYVGGDGNDVVLFSSAPGDFDDDGDVDGFDFLMWQRGESPNPLSPSDLLAWQTNYGAASPLSASSTIVPEPSGLVLAAICSPMICWRARRTTSKIVIVAH